MSVEKLRADYEKAEAKLNKLGNEYDEGKRKLRERYQDRLAKAAEDARLAQKALCDAEAVEALRERFPDEEELASFVRSNPNLPDELLDA